MDFPAFIEHHSTIVHRKTLSIHSPHRRFRATSKRSGWWAVRSTTIKSGSQMRPWQDSSRSFISGRSAISEESFVEQTPITLVRYSSIRKNEATSPLDPVVILLVLFVYLSLFTPFFVRVCFWRWRAATIVDDDPLHSNVTHKLRNWNESNSLRACTLVFVLKWRLWG